MNLVGTHYGYYIELLQDVALGKLDTHPTLVICLPRVEFLHQVAGQVSRQTAHEESSYAQSAGSERNFQHQTSTIHEFLIPTLRLLALSQETRLVYCPTIPSLRGYLSTFDGRNGAELPGRSHLVIVDLLALHHGTSEFTLQGLSRTFAAAVSAAHAGAANLTLIECKNIEDPTNPDRGSRLWEKQVPLLNGSVKIGLEGSRWAGRALTIKKIASRWFNFQDHTERKDE